MGREQVRSRAEDFVQRGFQIDLIIANTLQRTNENVRIIGSTLGVPVKDDLDWIE